MIPICTLKRLLIFIPWGRKIGSMTEAMNRMVISGTPRIDSIIPMLSDLTTTIFDRRPRASSIPRGIEIKIPMEASPVLNISPPQRDWSTASRPIPPLIRKNTGRGKKNQSMISDLVWSSLNAVNTLTRTTTPKARTGRHKNCSG